VAAVEAASRDVAGVGWRELRQVFDRATMGNLLYELKTRAEDDLRVRLARALFAIGWPGGGDAEAADSLRLILADDRLDHDDRDGAAGLVSGITTPGALLSLIVRPRYDTILAPGEDRLALLERVLAETDRTTAAALARDPRDPGLVLARAQYLRGIGRNAEALDLLRPFLRKPRDTVAASEQGLWLVNEAAYALIALGRNDEALRLMRRLAALPTQENAQLIGARINYSLLLWDTGHYDDALERAARLERDAADMTSAFGQAWISSASACALARLGRVDEAAARISDLRAESTLNPDALMRAYLCTGDADAAAALMVERLGGDDPVPAILSLQHYQSSHGDSQTGPLYDALGQIGARPDVRAALDRVGRVLTLPLARTRWGDF
jgi:tetratricopeptide (TPR) repeat protein